MRTDTAFVLTVLVLCYAVVSGLVKRWYIAPALIFVAFGMVLGPFGFGVIEAGADTASFTVMAQLALTVILFNQAPCSICRLSCAAATSPSGYS
jgi:NhaP-type Na+/H+ and K+/H+ antiporter